MVLARASNSRLLRPLLVVLLTAAAIMTTALLVQRADSSRRAQIAIGSLRLTVSALETAPFNADPGAGGSRSKIATEIRSAEATLAQGLSVAARSGAPPATIASARADLAKISPVVAEIYRLATGRGGLSAAGPKVPATQGLLKRRTDAFSGVLEKLSRWYAARAESARVQAEAGGALAMLLLLAVFAFFYFRSERLVRENQELLGASREEASTDALTGLFNRRALKDDLSLALSTPVAGREVLFAMFDLDGFKQYNDTFGHAAGDALLQRLGGRLTEAMADRGVAYRMGGDEFCMIAPCAPEEAEGLLDRALVALRDSGEGWRVGCSLGAVWVPSEASTQIEAVQIADERMYAGKSSRSSASRQVTDALLQVISEQDQSLDRHGERVAELSGAVAEKLGQPEHEVNRIKLAASLHDVGKIAIPEKLLNKPGPLDEQEWAFIRRHTLIGERIVLAAPALANAAPLLRSSHERIDGHGYPDGLLGYQIPLGARIIAACDAFDAMTSVRPYGDSLPSEVALEELNRCSGSQFDPHVVDAICAIVEAATAPSVLA
jgi:diguanylate cyclase (GGDEF)-like protein